MSDEPKSDGNQARITFHGIDLSSLYPLPTHSWMPCKIEWRGDFPPYVPEDEPRSFSMTLEYGRRRKMLLARQLVPGGYRLKVFRRWVMKRKYR